VLFVDDSRDFLLNFVLQLDEGLAYRIYDSPFEALESIKQKHYELEKLNQRCASEYTEAKNCPLTNYTVNLDLAAIHAEVYNPHRFSEVSVVVVDYAMPGMNGVEFCRQLESPNIKKILLTGQADESVAIQAFNDGLIHRYVKKSDPNVANLITDNIEQLQQQYFLDMSATVLKLLAMSSPTCLNDENFSRFFKQLRQEKGIVEFYLADNSGSFLLLDDDANISFLIMRSEADMKLYYDLALDNGAPESVLEHLSKREKLPCFWQANDLVTEWDEWATYLLPANKITSNENYYYAYIEGTVLFNVKQEKLLSYHRYLDEIDAEELMIA